MIHSCLASRTVHIEPTSTSIDYELRLIDASNQNLTVLPSFVLEHADKVEHLILDGNNLTEYFLNVTFANLKTLSLNTNRICDVGLLLKTVSKRCPNLSFLSLIGNPGWPHHFSSNEPGLYKQYSCAVSKFLPRLAFLDSCKISLKKLVPSMCRIS
ncbi:hypothetical protein L596_003289 [Steinernema carpocapsae]|uniref:U2A'/phosphoprotein 32 family A C-terminal domain-containing protein n=1 Tax=Steinernema carpocapsae TaxID=34508 RepID=A0A4U8URS7_STECR|nr:hypothetical protein L596_003289 [Steinernema carpocapsae]